MPPRIFPYRQRRQGLKSMLALFAVPSVRFEVRLILRAQDVTPVALDFRSRLGYGTFLLNQPATGDEHSTRYYLTF